MKGKEANDARLESAIAWLRCLPPEAREIWRMALAGGKIHTICRELGRRGILTPSGKRDWNTNTLRNVLKNRAYSGVIEALKQESVEPRRRRKATYEKTSR